MALAERNLASRILLYYLAVFSGLLLLGALFPEIKQFMASTVISATDGNAVHNALQNGALPEISVTPQAPGLFNDRALALLISLFSTVLFTLPLAWTFSLSHPTEQYSSIRETIFLLPITVASVVVIVQHSIALAFSLAGIVAAVRFRSNIKTPADAMFVFAALAIGLAAGVSEIAVAGIGSMFFCLTYIVLRMTGVVDERSSSPAPVVDAQLNDAETDGAPVNKPITTTAGSSNDITALSRPSGQEAKP